MFATAVTHGALFRPKICTKLSSFQKVVVMVLVLVVFDCGNITNPTSAY